MYDWKSLLRAPFTSGRLGASNHRFGMRTSRNQVSTRNRLRRVTVGMVLILIPVLLLVHVPADTASAQTLRVAVAPFSVYSKEDLSYLSQGIQEMINTQLLQRGVDVVPEADVKKALRGTRPARLDEAKARGLAKAMKADYIIYGSLTTVGQRISLDARMVDAMGLKPTATIFLQDEGIENLASAVEKLARAVSQRVSGGTRVAGIRVDGNKRIEDDAVLRVIQTREGDIYSANLVSADLKRIYKMNYFEDVKVDVKDTPQGKVITFIVEEKSVVAQIDFSGNRKLETEDLTDALGYSAFTIMDLRKIKESIESLKAAYREKGYYKAEIDYEIKTLGPKRVAVHYHIKEGKRLYVRRIEFEGNKAVDDGDLEDEMETSTKHIFYWLTDAGILKQEDLDEDVEKIASYYYDHGFIKARVGEPQVIVEDDGLTIRIPIVEGPQYKVGKIDVTGELIAEKEVLTEDLKLEPGELYSRKTVRTDLRTLKTFYADQGYAYVVVFPQIVEQPGSRTVDVIYKITKGHLVTFERISIVGNSRTRDKVIRRQLKLKEGDQFSADGLRKSNMALHRLGYFKDVQINNTKGSDDTKMNLKLEVTEQPTGAFAIGAGYSSYNNVFGSVTVSEKNLFGRGQYLALDLSFGGRATNYTLGFTEPWLFDIPLTAGFDLFNNKYEYDAYTKNTVGFALRAGYPIWFDFQLSGRYMYESIEIDDVDPDASQVIKDLEGRDITSSLTLQLRRDTRDAVFNPTVGSENTLWIVHAGGLLGGTNHFTKYILDSGWFFPTPVENWTLFLRGKAGLATENKEDGLPVYERFFLGGMNSIRGYDWFSISPVDPATGDRIGGDKMALFNVELIFPVAKEAGLMGVIFYDQGDAWTDNSRFDFGDMPKSYGAGIRYYSPIGPLRLEYGRAINPGPDDPKENWEFSVGTFF